MLDGGWLEVQKLAEIAGDFFLSFLPTHLAFPTYELPLPDNTKERGGRYATENWRQRD